MKVYAARVADIAVADKKALFGLLDRKRQKKINELKNEKDIDRSMAAGLLLRYSFLKWGYDINKWQDAVIECEEYGKPYIKDCEEFNYSLSHSGEWVICAADSEPIGADIQEMRNWRLQLAKRFYNEKEYARLLMLKESDKNKQTKEFYSMWSAKESVVKLSGRGIGAGISRYITDDDYSCIYDTGNNEKIMIRLYDELEGYIACVCSRKGIFPEKLEVTKEIYQMEEK